MMTRSFGSFCSLLLVWLCALGAGPTRHPATQPLVARGAAELALRDVAEVPLVGTRAVSARSAAPRLVERDAPPTQAPIASSRVALAADPTRATHATLERQSAAHAGRPRWRVNDAAAPPIFPV
jgi:hypothetical protein